eukprot:COSAG02_NODE_35711_length_464_cov_1.257534_1_plen_39_part_01
MVDYEADHFSRCSCPVIWNGCVHLYICAALCVVGHTTEQ